MNADDAIGDFDFRDGGILTEDGGAEDLGVKGDGAVGVSGPDDVFEAFYLHGGSCGTGGGGGIGKGLEDFGFGEGGAVLEEVEVGAFVGLGDVFDVEFGVAAVVAWGGGFPGGAAGGEVFVADVEVQFPVGDVEGDEVAILDEGEGAADGGFGGDVEGAGAVGGAGHAAVGEADHVAHALEDEFFRDGELAPFGHAGSADGAGVAEDEDGVRGDVEVHVFDGGFHVGVGVEDEGGAGVGAEVRGGGGVFDDGAVGAEVAAEDGGAAVGLERVGQGADDVGVVGDGGGDVFAEGFAGDGGDVGMEEVLHAVEEGGEAAGEEEFFHEVLAGGAEVGEEGDAAGDFVELVEGEFDAEASGHGDEVDDGVGGAAEGHVDGDGVLEGAGVDDGGGFAVEPSVFDDLTSGGGGHAGVGAVDGGDGGGAGEDEAEGFGEGGEGGGGAHGHAVARGAGDAVFDLAPFLPGEVAGAFFVPVFPDVGAGAEGGAAPVAFHHGAAGHVDDGDVGGEGAHEEAGGGLVATAEEDGTVDGVGAEDFLSFHGEEVAMEHGGGFGEHLADGHDGDFHGVAAGLEDAAFDRVGGEAEVHVTGVQVAPGVEDADDGFADVVFGAPAGLFGAGAVAEGAEFVAAVPAVGAELFGGLAGGGAVGHEETGFTGFGQD